MTMVKGSNWGGNYSRLSFDELKRYYAMLKEQGKEVLDDEFNILQDILLTLQRRTVLDFFGDGCIGNAFKIVGTGANNNFTITGGAAPDSGALSAWVAGMRLPLPATVTYLVQEVSAPALNTPGGNRTDSVYLDIWLDEVGPVADSGMIDPTLAFETSRRLKIFYKVLVVEGGSTPANYTDANGQPHFTMLLAQLNRTATAAINAGMVVDKRNVLPNGINRFGDSIPGPMTFQAPLTLGSGLVRPVTVITAASAALLATQSGIIKVDATANNVALTLPAANLQAGLDFDIERIDTSTHTVTITVANTGSETIGPDNSTVPLTKIRSVQLATQGERLEVEADGATNWLTRSNIRTLSDGWRVRTGLSKIILAALGDSYLAANADYAGGSWNRQDISKAAAALHLNAAGLFEALTAAAGANPISWIANLLWTNGSVVAGGSNDLWTGVLPRAWAWTYFPNGHGFRVTSWVMPQTGWSVGTSYVLPLPAFPANPYGFGGSGIVGLSMLMAANSGPSASGAPPLIQVDNPPDSAHVAAKVAVGSASAPASFNMINLTVW